MLDGAENYNVFPCHVSNNAYHFRLLLERDFES